MSLLDDLRRDGIALPSPLDPTRAAEIVAYLKRCPMHDAHVPWRGTRTAIYDEAVAQRWPYFSVAMADVLAAPHWFELGLAMHDLSRDYFGQPPRFYSVNAFWTQPADDTLPYTQAWHRDGDDDKQLALFMLGTDVNEPGDGEHQYQRGSQMTVAAGNVPGFDDPDPATVQRVYGPAGMLFYADNGGFHRGLPPRAPRLLVWARWCINDPPRSYVWDAVQPCDRSVLGDRYPEDTALQEAIRLLVR